MKTQDTDKTVDTEEVKHLDINRRERIFPILRKLDAIWQHTPNLTFQTLIENILKIHSTKNIFSDEELLKILDNIIEEDGIKFK